MTELSQMTQPAQLTELSQMTQPVPVSQLPQMTQLAQVTELPQMTQPAQLTELPQMTQLAQMNFRQAMHWRFHGAGSLQQDRQQEIMITIDEHLVFMALTVSISEIKHF